MPDNKPALNSPEFWEAKGRKYIAQDDMRDRESEFREAALRCIGPVLELGPAFGGFTQYLPADMHYVGIDLSGYMVGRARARFPGRIFLVANGAALSPAWNGAFETVAAFQFLEHFEKPIDLVTRIREIARQRFVFSVPRGQPTHSAHYHDGHVAGWHDEVAFREEFEAFGALTFWRGNPNHICGMIEFRQA